jgi:hypothetical protein
VNAQFAKLGAGSLLLFAECCREQSRERTLPPKQTAKRACSIVVQHSRKAQSSSEREREKEGERMEIEGKERRGYIFEWVLLPL